MKSFHFKYDWTENTEWWLPDAEEMMQGQFPILDEQIDFVLEAIGTMTEHGNQRTCVQAGGAFGMYPIRLAHHFEKVWTFEPLTENLECLRENMKAFDELATERIVIAPCALWHEETSLWMDYTKEVKNSYGAHHVSRANRGGERVDAEPLDFYALEEVDLLWLDVEGAEVYALLGASETLRRCKPVVVVEQRYLPQMRSLDVQPDSAGAWLRRNGYKEFGRTHGDLVFVPQ